MEITELGAVALGKEIQAGRIGVVEAAKACLEQIEKREAELHAFITVDREGALKQAERVEKTICENRRSDSPNCCGCFGGSGRLAGVPMALKDNICTRGLRTTCGSRILENFIPPYDAAVTEKLQAAGAVILGKTNMDEFAMGSTTETSFFGATKNPWNTNHVPGGSSGGSCAAAAAGGSFYALGSDTGGSIRQPSAYCGVVGLKPTYGTVSRYGLVAYASSLDQIGPVARSVEDCAAVLEVIAGQDKRDSTSVKNPEAASCTEALIRDVRGLRIGIPTDYFGDGLDAEVREAVLAAAKVLEAQGAIVEEFPLGLMEYAVPAYYMIASAEASSNLARFDGVKYGYRSTEYEDLHEMYKKSRSEGFGSEVKRRIMLGSFVLSAGYYDAYYLKALKAKTLIKQAFDRTFASYDILLTPTAPATAPELGKSLTDPLKMYQSDIDTVAVNLAGLPAVSLPCGQDSKGLPIGLQLIGDCFQEKTLIRAAYTYEQTVKGAQTNDETV